MPPIALSPGGLAEEMKALLRARESRAMPVCKARDLRVQRQGKTPPAKPGPTGPSSLKTNSGRIATGQCPELDSEAAAQPKYQCA